MLKGYKPLILHVIDSLDIGGAEKLLVNTIEILPDYQHVICFLNGENKFGEIKNVKQLICLHHRSDIESFKTIYRLRRIITKFKPSLVHAHLLKSTWFSRFAVRGKCPLIFTVHNKLSEDAFKVNKLSYYFERFTYSPKHEIIGVSNEVLKDYNKWIGIKGRSFVIYNLIEEKFFKNEIKKQDTGNGLKLIAIGNLRRQKNYLNLLKAFHYLKEYNITLDIYGDGDEYAQLDHFIKENNLPVQLKGKAANLDELIPLYQAFILPSIFEGYGIAVVEAMAGGLPVILSDMDVFREVSDNKAIYFNPLDPLDIANAIMKLSNSSCVERNEFGAIMKQRAMEIGSPLLFRKNILGVYQDALKNME